MRRELKSTLRGFTIYLIVTLIMLVAALIFRSYLQTIHRNGVLLKSNLLLYPYYLSLLISGVYLGLTSTVTISREREEGTLETLLFGPVDSLSYLLGKYLHQMVCYTGLSVVFLVYLYLAAVLLNLFFAFSLLKMTILFLFLGSCLITFGLFLSTLTNKIKNSIFLFLVVIFAFLLVQFLYNLLNGIEVGNGFFLYLRNTVEFLNAGVSWISPFSFFDRGLEVVRLNSSPGYLQTLVTSILYSGFFFTAAVLNFRRKGAIR